MQGRRRYTAGLIVLGLGVLYGADAQAHFRLVSPEAMTVQNDLGDPQKAPPCGGGTDFTDAVTVFQAGETITVTIDETIYHPGHYRVVLAVNDPGELPDAPPVTPMGNDACASTIIDDPPVFPVLADGELIHDAPFGSEQSFEVTLPDDVECESCTLQVIEFMSNHAAPCYYYHCATIAIEADPSPGSETGDAGDEASDAATSDGDDTSTTGAPSDDDGTATSPGGTTPGEESSGPATEGGTDGNGEQDTEDSGGCACSASQPRAQDVSVTLLGLLGLLRLRRPRR